MSGKNTNNKVNITVFSLAMLITGSIASIRNLPGIALFGDKLVFFFLFSAIVFLIPTGLISAWLSSSELKGGVYGWVKAAFGKKIGFLAIWLQWINTMAWYPTILSFVAGIIAYLINPQLAGNKYYLVTVILGVYWMMTLINLKGLHMSVKFASFCAIFGMIIPMTLIILLAVIWFAIGKPLQVSFNIDSLVPVLSSMQSWVSLTAIMTSFLGMELATVHVCNIKDPQRSFPKALLFSIIVLLISMMLGAISITFVLPHNEINLVSGVMQAFSNFFNVYHMKWFVPIITIMILIGSLGGMINWMISPAKGLLLAAQDGYLPKFFQKENKHGVNYVLLIIQAVLVSLICSAFLLMSSVNESYWLLTDISTNLYMLMYILMFISAIVLSLHKKVKSACFRIPFGNLGICFFCILGLSGCMITFIIGFFPPESINVGGSLHYVTVFITGIVSMILPIFGFYFYEKKYSKHNN